ncbi:MAG: arsenite methyltransferase [Ignavibacteria bacterium]|nr:arsenite methyltransferase [Ignavibacteria bacterium]
MEITEIKKTVKKAYTKVLTERGSGCCGTDCCSNGDNMAEDYTKLDGYVADADYGLGCGIPTEFANIKEGDTVLDLGSGAGNDVFIAAKTVGVKGKVIGLDMTEAMIEKANANKDKLGISNVVFRFGEIEEMPVENDSVDVVLSNCVLNLVPDKSKAFGEIHRVLKNGGHFTISDIVISGDLPGNVKQAAEMYAGCVAGAMEKKDYIDAIKAAGFKEVKVLKEKTIEISDESMLKFVSDNELKDYKDSGRKILSITVYGIK